jgi:cellulose synthase/poly-beta-1,6-N-acetylglucosamine synthase-like glycosyltransferase
MKQTTGDDTETCWQLHLAAKLVSYYLQPACAALYQRIELP